MVYLSTDVESSGVGKDCQILELGCILEDTKLKLDYENIPKFRAKFYRHGYITGQINGILMNVDLLREIQDNPKDCYMPGEGRLAIDFLEFLKKNDIRPDDKGDTVITIAGKNVSFDYGMISEQTKLFQFVKVSHRFLDPTMLYTDFSKERPPGLQECLDKAGIETKVKHTSLEDAWDVINLLRKFY